MKWLIMIFTLYISVLAISPCGDAENHCDEKSTTTSSEEHNHDHDADDSCTPFCCCSCCGTQMTITNYQLSKIQTELVNEHISEKVSIEYVSSHSTYFGEIWQPPQINA